MRVPALIGAPQSPFIYLRPSRAIHKCVPHRAGNGAVEGHRCGGYATAQRPANTELFKQWIEQWKPSAYRMEAVVELFGQAPGPVEPKAVSAKVRAAHHAFLARCGLNAVQADL